MQIVNTPPEGIYKRAQEKWGVDFDKVVFTVGDTLHTKHPPNKDLIAHEEMHSKQKAAYSLQEWLDRNFEDDKFRYDQELQAYRAQDRWIKENIKDRNKQAPFLSFYAKSLSGSIYGNLVSEKEAHRLIKL